MTRIGYVAKVFPRTSETFVVNEMRAMESFGEPLTVFSLHRNPAPVPHGMLAELAAPVRYVEDVVPDEKKVRRAAAELTERFGFAEEERPRFLPRKYVRLAVALADLATDAGVEHLHAHFASRSGHVAALAAALAGCSYSITAHAKDIYHEDVDREVLAWKIRNARFVVTVTEFNRRHLIELAGADAARRIVRLYNGVDLSRFAPGDRRTTSPPLLLAIGRLIEKKGFEVLVDACARLRDRGLDFRTEIIGGGELEGALRERIAAARLDAHVHLAGTQPTETVAARLREAYAVVLPCVVGHDGNVDALPTALLEGMACGLPLVSTSISGIPEIIADGVTGRLVPPNDVAALADALAELLVDPARGRSMGDAGRRRAEELFDLHRNAATLHALLVEACESRGALR